MFGLLCFQGDVVGSVPSHFDGGNIILMAVGDRFDGVGAVGYIGNGEAAVAVSPGSISSVFVKAARLLFSLIIRFSGKDRNSITTSRPETFPVFFTDALMQMSVPDTSVSLYSVINEV